MTGRTNEGHRRRGKDLPETDFFFQVLVFLLVGAIGGTNRNENCFPEHYLRDWSSTELASRLAEGRPGLGGAVFL